MTSERSKRRDFLALVFISKKIDRSFYEFYHFVMASLAVIPSPPAVAHPIARLSPWFSLDLGGECLRSFSFARI